jgi:predicted negative regulator of RcsB-dependent stress response
VERFETEEQQVEAIKKFWKENGIVIIVGAILGLGGLWGWRYYQETQIAEQEANSDQYQAAVTLVEADGDDQQADELVTENTTSGYAVLTALKLAQVAIDNGDLEQAVNHLVMAKQQSVQPELAAVSSIRLARVQIELDQLENAMQTIESVTNEAYKVQVNEIKGDIYALQKNIDKATLAYSEALTAQPNHNLLKMKLDNLKLITDD